MSRDYTVKTTKEIKKTLQAKFPGVKFSVTKGRGTASHWVRVGYVNGPPETVVRDFCGQFNDSENDDLMTDLWCGCQYTNVSRELSKPYNHALVGKLDLTAGPPTLEEQVRHYDEYIRGSSFGGVNCFWAKDASLPTPTYEVVDGDGHRLVNLEYVAESLRAQGYEVRINDIGSKLRVWKPGSSDEDAPSSGDALEEEEEEAAAEPTEIELLRARVAQLEDFIAKKLESEPCADCGKWITKYNTMVAGEYICDDCLLGKVDGLEEGLREGAREQVGRRLARNRRNWSKYPREFILKHKDIINKYSH